MARFDLDYLNRIEWSLFEASCVLADIDPEDAGDSANDEASLRLRKHHYANLKSATDLSPTDAGHLPFKESRTGYIKDRRVRPWDVLQWAIARDDKFPDELHDIRKPAPVPATVEAAPADTSASDERALATKERNTLLTIIGLLAGEAKVDWQRPTKAAETIVSLADQANVSLGVRTVEEHLKRIPEAMRTRMK